MLCRFLMLCCLALAGGCQSGPRAFNDVHTGKRGFVSAETVAHFEPSISVRAIAGYSQSSDVFVVFTEVRNLGGIYLYPKEVWSFGEEFEYTHLDRLKIACSDGCIAIEKGKIALSRQAFEAAARTGLEFRLVARRASILCKIPPEIFEQVLRPMRDGQGPTRSVPADRPRPPDRRSG